MSGVLVDSGGSRGHADVSSFQLRRGDLLRARHVRRLQRVALRGLPLPGGLERRAPRADSGGVRARRGGVDAPAQVLPVPLDASSAGDGDGRLPHGHGARAGAPDAAVALRIRAALLREHGVLHGGAHVRAGLVAHADGSGGAAGVRAERVLFGWCGRSRGASTRCSRRPS